MTEAGRKRRADGPGLNMARAQVWFPGGSIRDSAQQRDRKMSVEESLGQRLNREG